MTQPFRREYTGNGTQRNFTVPDDYIRRSHIVVTLDGVPTTAYTFQSATVIRFNTAPAAGVAIVIDRKPPIDDPLNQYERESQITAKSLNDNFRQSLQRTERADYADLADQANRATLADRSLRSDVADLADLATEAEKLTPGRTINGVLFDGTEDITITNVDESEIAAEAVLAFQANSLTPGRNINGVLFNGTQNITVRAAPSHQVYQTVFVSPDGNNGFNGRNEDRAVASYERALEIINGRPNWTVISLGGVPTAGEIPVPDYTTIVGRNFQRQNTITPTSGNEESNVFLCGNRVHLVNLKFSGWRHDDLENPTKGFAMAFRPGAIILPGGVPYGQNCIVGNAFTDVPTPLPNDFENRNPAQPFGMGCAIADASVLSAYSVFPNIMTWGFTPASPNGIGYLAKHRSHINAVNGVSVGSHIPFMTQDGGNMVLSACSSQFGDYAMWSEGSEFQTIPLKVASAPAPVAGARATINAARAAILANVIPYITGLKAWTSTQIELFTKDTGLILDAIGTDVEFGNHGAMLNVTDGLFTFTGDAVFPFSDLPEWKLSFTRIQERILAETSFSAPVDTFIVNMFDRLVATLDNHFFEVGLGPAPGVVEPVRRRRRSLINAVGHQMTAQLTGTQFFRVPPQGTPRNMRRAIVRRNGGRINFSGNDDRGNALFVGGLEINARSGELGGPPFDLAVFNRSVETAIASSF
jgi:hypothetical protein